MHPIVRRDALAILTQVINILKQKDKWDAFRLKRLSNHIIHNASVFQDECSVSVTILIYSLAKIWERNENIKNYPKILQLLQKAREQVKGDKEEEFHETIKNIFNEIKKDDAKIKMYTQEVVNQAQIKKGCELCEHGISIGKAAEIIGVSQWDLMNYIGKTEIHDENHNGIVNVAARLKKTREIFS